MSVAARPQAAVALGTEPLERRLLVVKRAPGLAHGPGAELECALGKADFEGRQGLPLGFKKLVHYLGKGLLAVIHHETLAGLLSSAALVAQVFPGDPHGLRLESLVAQRGEHLALGLLLGVIITKQISDAFDPRAVDQSTRPGLDKQ